MNRRWLIILLLISVAFNFAVLGSFVYLKNSRAQSERDRPYGPAMRRDNRGPKENPAFSDSTRALWNEFADIKAEFMLELSKDPLDMDSLDDILARSLANQAILENDMAERLIRHRQSMSASEAKEFFMQRYEEMINRQNYRRNKEKPHKTRNNRRTKR